MTIDRFEYEWAESGDTTEPSDAKKQVGWVGGDRVSIEYLNWLQNRVEEKSNETVRVVNRDIACSDGITWAQLATKLFTSTGDGSSRWSPDLASNIISLGATVAINELQLSTYGTDQCNIMALDIAGREIHVYDPYDLSLVDSSGALAGLPSGGGETWVADSFCSDGTYVYVMFTNTNATPDTHYIQAYNISDWSVKSGWSATGTALPGTGSPLTDPLCRNRVIIANATYLATANAWNDADSNAMVSIIAIADGSILGSGDGSNGYEDPVPTGAICSDGTYVYFGVVDVDGNPGGIDTALISNPATGLVSGGDQWIEIVSTYTTDMVYIGEHLVCVMTDYPQTQSYIYAVETGVNSAQTQSFTIDTNDEYKYMLFGSGIAFDGINVWIRAVDENDMHVLLRFNPGYLSEQSQSNLPKISEVCERFTVCRTDKIGNTTNPDEGIYQTPVLFDGTHIWTVIETDLAETRTGDLVRLAVPSAR